MWPDYLPIRCNTVTRIVICLHVRIFTLIRLQYFQHPAHMLIIRPLPPGEWFTYIAIHLLIAFQNKKHKTNSIWEWNVNWALSTQLLGFGFRLKKWHYVSLWCPIVAYVLYVTKSTIEIVCLFLMATISLSRQWHNCFGFVCSRTPHKYVQPKSDQLRFDMFEMNAQNIQYDNKRYNIIRWSVFCFLCKFCVVFQFISSERISYVAWI